MPKPRIDIAIPVLNEAQQLRQSIETLVAFLDEALPYEWRVLIVDNGSTDATGDIGRQLAQDVPRVAYRRLEERGRGRALRDAWSTSEADVCSYMDVDLSTNLRAFPHLIETIVHQGFDVAIGSRLMAGAQVRRSLKREILSRGYNGLVKMLFRNRFSDGQCGFKAIRTDVAQALLPLIVNQHWFFDTELLLLAERFGCSIAEVPVAWIEDLDSRVKLVATAWEDVQGLLRVRRTRYPRLKPLPARQALPEPVHIPAA